MAKPVDGNVLTLENPAFRSYLICVSLLVLKMMLTTILTIFQRMKNKAFISPEDLIFGKEGSVTPIEPVERVRRAHLNDLENILMFFTISFAYLWTNPATWLINALLFLFTLARYLHTIVYAVVVLPQPSRGILFNIGFLITGYMSLHTLFHVIAHIF